MLLAIFIGFGGAGWPILALIIAAICFVLLRKRATVRAARGEQAGRAGGRPSAPTISATIARPLPSSSVGRGRRVRSRAGVAVAAAWSARGALSAAAAVDGDDRGGVVGVLGADPAHDLAAAVGLQRLERQLVAGLARDLDREAEVLEGAGRDRVVLARRRSR